VYRCDDTTVNDQSSNPPSLLSWKDIVVGTHCRSVLPIIPLEDLQQMNEKAISRFCTWMARHSYAVVRINDEVLLEAIQSARKLATEFFTHQTLEEKKKTFKLFGEVGRNQGLLGFNQPHKAKEVFRIRRPLQNQDQNWPLTPPTFKETILDSLTILENLLSEVCLPILTQTFGVNGNDLTSKYCDRPALISDDTTPQFSSSPYDLFYYHNNNTEANSNEGNPQFIQTFTHLRIFHL
jgi:hypothetical protein